MDSPTQFVTWAKSGAFSRISLDSLPSGRAAMHAVGTGLRNGVEAKPIS